MVWQTSRDVNPVELTEQLIKIDTRNPPGATQKAVEFLEDLFSNYTTRIMEREQGKPNLIIHLNKGEPELMLTSHLDTVPSSDALLNPVKVDGKLYGRGACDAKGCIAAIISAALNSSPECGLKLCFTCDEEIGGVNGLGFVFESERADYVLIGEPTGVDRIGVMQASVVSADITVNGESGHTASKDIRDGAIYRAAEYIMRAVEKFSSLKGDFGDFAERFRQMNINFELKGSNHAVFNPAIISGGIKRNVVASKCKIEADIRFAPWIHQRDIRSALTIDNADFKINGVLRAFGMFVDGVDLEKDHRFLNILANSIKARGYNPVAVCSLGVGDTRHVRKHGVPAFYYGPGGDSTLHSDNEYVKIPELFECSKIIKNLIESF
jgi:acetylornithine deacetylase/succinyl-diaminopimelate desuccinylase-like protein